MGRIGEAWNSRPYKRNITVFLATVFILGKQGWRSTHCQITIPQHHTISSLRC